MKRSTLASLLFMLIAYGLYFRLIDSLLESNRLLAFVIFLLVWMLLRTFHQALEGRSEFWDKLIDPQTSVWLTVGLFIVVPLLIFSLG